MPEQVTLVWFKRDLRVHDHRPLVEASRARGVIPLYIVEPDYWHQADTSGRQWMFISEGLEDLQERLSGLGAPLIIRCGEATSILREIIQNHGVTRILSHEETGNMWTFKRDIAVHEMAQDLGVDWKEYPQFGVQRGPTDRDGWSRAWDKFMSQPLFDVPSHLTPVDGIKSERLPRQEDLGLKDICPERQRGGYENGLKTLESFLDERGEKYRVEMSSPISGRESCSRISTFLSTGTLSMREAAQSLWSRQRELKFMASEGEETGMWRGSMSSFNGRLHWHCHFMQKLEDEPEQELENIHPFYKGLRPSADEDVQAGARLKAWSEGQTGFPFVDACMRSLNATGWTNFRMRAMLMSFASYHLWLDWRDSGLLYAQKFTDYEPGIHWPQVQMQSGTTGINTVRMYNPVKQGYDQDPEGSFTRKWVPELANIPDPFLQEPWKWPDPKETIPAHYPARIIDHVKAGKEARDKIYAVRRRDGHRDIAKAIAAKHGSRKRR